jgi:formylmethanofuran dehydrogenase subunit A
MQEMFFKRVKDSNTIICYCGGIMHRMIAGAHTKIGMSMDAKDPGKVTMDKNEALKKRESGYSHEERNLRADIGRTIEERSKNS